MPNKKQEELEERILEQVGAAVRKMMEKLPESGRVSLSEMEKAVGVLGERISQETLQSLVEAQAAVREEAAVCEKCGSRMQRRGKRKKRVVTLRGEVEVEREYYVCSGCGAGRFPPG